LIISKYYCQQVGSLANQIIGVSMAVEDAAALAKALSYMKDRSDLLPALQLVEKLRIPRTKRVQEASFSNGQVLHLCDGPSQRQRDAALNPSAEGKLLDNSPYGLNDPKTQAWCYGYNVVRDVEDYVRSGGFRVNSHP
jgi:salicylate hydroxylase